MSCTRTYRASIAGLATLAVIVAICLSRRRAQPWWIEGSPEYPR